MQYDDLSEPSRLSTASSPAVVIAALMAASFVAADGVTAIYVMLPAIFREFPTQSATVGWIVTSFFLVAAMIVAVGGRLADLIGRRTIAVALLAIAGVGSIVGALATAPWMLIAASVLLACTSTLVPILIGMAREYLPADKVGLAIGAIAAAGSAGSGLIFLVVGIVVDRFGRQGGYLLTTTFAITTIVLLLVAIPRSPHASKSLGNIDFVRGVLFGPAVAGMILAVELGSTRGWNDGVAPALMIASVALALYWVRNQFTQARPLLDLRVMAQGVVPRTLFVMLMLGVVGVQQGQTFSILLQQASGNGAGFGFSATLAGLVMIPINGTAAIVAPLGGALSRRYGARLIALAGATIIMVAWALMAVTFTSLVPFVLSAMLSLAGLSLLMPANYLLIVEATPHEMTSGAVGLGSTLFDLGFAVGAQLVLGLLFGHAVGVSPIPGPTAFRLVFQVLSVGSVVMVLALAVGKWRRRPRSESGVSI